MGPHSTKKVAIVQSNYIPWKGYFDLIHSVDEFILYDDVQYTKRDWRNRNLLKTPQGLHWLTIPIEVKGQRFQLVKDAKISQANWGEKHWTTLQANYGRAPYFRSYREIFEPLYRNPGTVFLSEINFAFIQAVCQLLGIRTKLSFSMNYAFHKDAKNQQLVSLCEQAEATHYISGPAAASYLDPLEFEKKKIQVSFFDYSNYPQYHQSHPPFEHGVSILDLLFNEGPAATRYMKSFLHEEKK